MFAHSTSEFAASPLRPLRERAAWVLQAFEELRLRWC